MSLIYRLNFPRIRLLKIESILRILIILIGICSSASAQSLNEYCLSTVGKVDTTTKTKEQNLTPQLPSFIGSVEDLPELYSQPCNKLYRFFWGECDRETFFSYSLTLNKAFIQGHRRTNWGGDFTHLEISPSGTKSVPDRLVDSDFLEDVPALNGALFQDDKGEALFYDGSKITNISFYFPNREKRKKRKKVNNYHPRSWNIIKTYNRRIFIVDNGFYSKQSPFVMELKTGISIKFIDVHKKVANQPWEFYTLKNDSRLWVISRKSVFAEVMNELKEVIITSPHNIITVNTTIKQLTDGSVAFQVENINTKSITNYFLRQASPTANCEIMLDLSKPVKLEPEL